MAHPWQHSLVAARRFGGVPDDYLAIESWLDYTKSHIADCRHRLFLHNSWGIFVGERILGATFIRPSDRKIIPMRPILEWHIIEDFGSIPTLARCLAQLPISTLTPRFTLDEHSQYDSDMFGGVPEDYSAIHHFLNWPCDYLPDLRYQRILHNGWGIALTVEALGTTMNRLSDNGQINVRSVATAHVQRECGTVPTVESCLEGLAIQRWMCNRAMSTAYVETVVNIPNER